MKFKSLERAKGNKFYKTHEHIGAHLCSYNLERALQRDMTHITLE